jgi:hypothetical protein
MEGEEHMAYSSNEINIRIVPKRIRWPEPRASDAWAKAHDCVDALQDLVRDVDLACLQVEKNKEFSSDAIRQRSAGICDKTMTKLANFNAFGIAEKALVDNITLLERLSNPDPQQAQMRDNLNQALRDLREGVEATRRMVQERCKIRERASVW